MLIKCPYCGERPSEEFTCRGDAKVTRPTEPGDGISDDWYDYVFLRDNPKGRFSELWHHSGGCRSWLIVDRDTQSHEIHRTSLARPPLGDASRKGAKS